MMILKVISDLKPNVQSMDKFYKKYPTPHLKPALGVDSKMYNFEMLNSVKPEFLNS